MAAQEFIGADAFSLALDERKRPEVRGDFMRVHRTGCGVMLIKREVLETLAQAHPELWAQYPSPGLDGFERVFQPFAQTFQNANGVFLGEDFAFCRRWTDTGGQIWSCYTETIAHVGRETFMGNFQRKLIEERKAGDKDR